MSPSWLSAKRFCCLAVACARVSAAAPDLGFSFSFQISKFGFPPHFSVQKATSRAKWKVQNQFLTCCHSMTQSRARWRQTFFEKRPSSQRLFASRLATHNRLLVKPSAHNPCSLQPSRHRTTLTSPS